MPAFYTIKCDIKTGVRLTVAHASDIALPAHVVLQYGLNPDVPGAFWEKWVSENADYGPYKAGLITAVEPDEPPQAEEPEPAPPKPPHKPKAAVKAPVKEPA
jgi:hypothetical protein